MLLASPEATPADRLEWRAPQTCPTHAQVLARAQRLAGTEHERQTLAVGAIVDAPESAGTPWRLRLAVRDDGGEHVRELEAEQCEALADVTALVLALGLDPFGVSMSAQTDPRPEPPVTRAIDDSTDRVVVADRPVEPTPDASTRPALTRRSRHAGRDQIGFGIRLLAGGEVGALPGGSGGGRLALALLTKRLRLEAHGSYWLPRPARAPDTSGIGADVRLADGGVDACVRFYAGRHVELPVCAGAELGLMRADAVGTPEPRRAHGAWAAARLAPALSWRVADWVGLWVGVEGFVALARPRFRFGEEEVFSPAPAGGRVLAGVEMGF